MVKFKVLPHGMKPLWRTSLYCSAYHAVVGNLRPTQATVRNTIYVADNKHAHGGSIIEKDKTESLLANVLPKNTATEIMEKGKATK